MYTLAFVTKRVPGMTREEFFEHYRVTHYNLSSTLPGLVSYQQAALDHDGAPWGLSGPFAEYDALSLYTFASKEEAVAAFASPIGADVDADTPLFMEWSSILAMPTEVIQRFDAAAEGGDLS